MKLITKYPEFFEKFQMPKAMQVFGALNVYDAFDLLEKPELKPDMIVSEFLTPTQSSLDLLHKHNCDHFIQESRESFLVELLVSGLLRTQPMLFFNEKNPFLLHRFFKENTKSKVRSQSWRFNSNKQKAAVLDELMVFTDLHPKTSAFTEIVVQIADELVTNAIFHGPVNEHGKHIFREKSRRDEVIYPDNRKAILNIYHDDERMLLGCEDPWGSLSSKQLIAFLKNRYDNPAPLDTDHGAGLGIKTVIDQSSDFYALVSPEEQTLIYCNFQLSHSLKKIQMTPKNLHFCEVVK